MTNKPAQIRPIEPDIMEVINILGFRESNTISIVDNDYKYFGRFELLEGENTVWDKLKGRLLEPHQFVMAILKCKKNDAWEWLKEEGLIE